MVVLHDDGRGWQEVSDPLITGSFHGTAVWGSSPDDVFVAGWDGIAYVLHHDGESWRRQETPGAWITAFWGTGPDDVYATDGAGQILHHDGAGWSIVASFDEPLHDIHGFGSGEVFVCGEGRIVARQGDQWIEMPIDTPRWPSSTRHHEQYTALWGPDPERLYCTGHMHDANVDATSAFTLVLDGGSWRFLEPPASAAIKDMWGVSDDEVYAVGRLSGVLRFDGSVWRPVPMTGLDTWPATDGYGVEFLCVWASGPDEIICGTRRSLWRFDGTRWSETAPFRGAADLWGTAADDLYAIEYRYADGPGPFLVMHHDGSAWEEIGAIERKPYKLHGLASGAIVAVGYGSSVWHHDGGVWTDIGPVGGPNFAIWGDELDGLLVGGHERDEIFRHDDGAWQTVEIPASLFTTWSILGDAHDLHLLSDRDDDVLRFDGVDWHHTRHVTVRARGGWTGEATLFAGGPHGRIFHRGRAVGTGRPAAE
ncbi:hypothetical protein GF314_15540 [bacterium]|nr:hypothetical protein [bacterium]